MKIRMQNKEVVKKSYDENRLFQYGLFMLGRRDYSCAELKEKMKKWQENENIINVVIDKMKSLNYINDERRATGIFQTYSSKEGATKLKRRMMLAGIDKELIKKIIENNQYNDNESLLLNLLEKKFKIYNAENYQKMVRFLGSKGFEYDEIKKTLEKFKKNNLL